ncbi:hypothetical protein L9F63_025096 [Diploptera punctata]|uniref:Ionotropic glutamate receptor C-terminal domain-containing protein n=1 Tax=Diploptera punctata TaxID=6984 RepID=A0AAD7ZCZ5_DIPPU|nr:hypothetical protein L9F63_025096 [Diploptera punctata]
MLYDNYQIVDCDVMIAVNESMQKTIHNLHTHHFNIYTWFPFQSGLRNDKESNITYLDTCYSNQSFQNNRHLFPRKVSNDLHGYPLRIFGFEFQYDVENGYEVSTNIDFNKLEIKFLENILNKLNLKASYSFQPLKNISDDEIFGVLMTKLLVDLYPDNADVIIGSLPLNDLLYSLGDPSVPFMSSPVQWYVPCSKRARRYGTMFRVFSPAIWIMVCITFSCFVIIIWLYEVISDTREQKNYKDIVECSLYLFSLSLGVSIPRVPFTFRVKILLVTWLIFCFAMTLIFQTFFTSFLVQPYKEKQISNLEELLDSEMDIGYCSVFELLINQFPDPYYQKIKNMNRRCMNYISCIEKALQNNYVTALPSFMIDYYKEIILKNPRYRAICPLEESIVNFSFSFYVRKGNPLLKSINKIMRMFYENGFVEKWREDHNVIGEKSFGSAKKNADIEQEKYVSFSLQHLEVGFFVLCLGYFISFIVFVNELIISSP